MLSQLKSVLRFSSIKGNIILALAGMGFFTLLLVVANFWFSRQIEENQQSLYDELAPVQLALVSTKAAVSSSILYLNVYLETGKESHKKGWNQLWEIITANQELIQKSKSLNRETAAHAEKLSQELSVFHKEQLQLIDHQEQQLSLMQQHVKELHQELDLLQAQLSRQMAEQREEQLSTISFLKMSSLAFFALCVLAGIFLGYLVISQIFRSLYHIKLAVKGLSQGNLPESIRESNNETSHILKELATLTSNLRNVQHFALQVGKGQFNNEINVFNNSGDLGTSLSGMRDSLANVAQLDKQRNWVNEGFAQFGDLLRNHNNSITELCDVVIANLVKYVSANQGAIFLKESASNQQSEEVLKLLSCYAYDRKKFLHKEILKGEGLCGQAWQENDIILIDDVPESYVNIRSGLGGASPKAVLVIPLVSNEQTQGVLELASFSKFEDYQVEFIRKISENLASAIATTKNTEKTHQLLSEFQELTEEMRAQEEEMRQNMEELKATQEEMARAQQIIQHKEHNLNSVINNTADTIFAIDRDYKITVVNRVLAEKYRKMGIELTEGTAINDILPKSAWEIWQPRYDRALAGEQFSLIEESSGSNGSRFAQTYHNPIVDESGQIVGVSVVSRDVTETVIAQKENEHKRSTLRSLIDFTDDTYFAIDRDYKILIANKTLKDRFAASNISLEEGENIFDKLPKDQLQSWKERYDRALSGESFVMVTERQVKDKTLTIEVHHHPILNAEGKVIGATVISKDITRWQQAAENIAQQESELQRLKKEAGIEDSVKNMVIDRATAKNRSEKY